MGVLDKFLDAIKLNDDDGYDDEEFYDEEDEYAEEPEPKKRRGLFGGRKNLREEYEEPDTLDDDNKIAEEPAPRNNSWAPSRESRNTGKKHENKQPATSRQQKKSSYNSSKITPMRNKQKQSTALGVVVLRPKNLEDMRLIADALMKPSTVVLNLEDISPYSDAQRVIDFTCGACYSLAGNLLQVADKIFIVTPEEVDISGDLQDLLNGAFDLPSIRSEY